MLKETSRYYRIESCTEIERKGVAEFLEKAELRLK
jgi:hypothetical protein